MVNSMKTPNLPSLGRWLALDTPLQKLAATLALSLILLIISAFIYTEQADTYDAPHVVAVLRQLVYETPFQPLFLIVALVPIYLAAARTSSRVGLLSGTLLMTASLLPFARFEVTDPVADAISLTEGSHNSLFQLAGPGHEMPQFVAAVTLLMMGGGWRCSGNPALVALLACWASYRWRLSGMPFWTTRRIRTVFRR